MQPTQKMLDSMQDQLWAMSDDQFYRWIGEWSPRTEAELIAGMALSEAELERRPQVRRRMAEHGAAVASVILDAMGNAPGSNSKH
jgi:hypothetical protein